MPEQRTIGADVRSILATGKGVPWWGAVLIAATATLIGMAMEAGSGHQELGGVFGGFYAVGCLLAVLLVRRAGIFTAIIQPPLLLFVAVPLAYYLMHESSFRGLKDIAITCGYPLIERFPLMLFTSSAVLLLGLIRWYLAMKSPQPVAPARPGVLAGLSTKIASASAGNGSVDENPGTRPARPRHVADRPAGGRSRPSQDRGTARARHARPSAAEIADAPPRRRSHRSAMDAERSPEPRRGQRDRDRTPPATRRDPRERRDSYRDQPPPRPPRGSRLEPYETGRGYQSHPQYGSYPPPPYDPRRRTGENRPTDDRHPVSRVRYRDSGPSDSDYRSR